MRLLTKELESRRLNPDMKLRYARFLISSAFVLAGSALIAPQVFAQTVDVPFSGTVPGACSFGTPVAGTLQLDNAGNNAGKRLFTQNPGQVAITCSQPVSIQVSPPTSSNAISPASQNSSVVVGSGANLGAAQGTPSAPLLLTNAGTDNLEVSMTHVDNNILAAGTYDFQVTLTVVP